MSENGKWWKHPVVRGIGSLWFGAALLVLVLVAMACATVYESWHGTEAAMVAFYRAWWFQGLALLLAVNVAAALVLRFPFRRSQLGFVVTHVSILIVLAGALTTQRLGVEGQLALAEGETSERFATFEETLVLVRTSDGAETGVEPGRLPGGGLEAVDNPPVPPLALGDVTVRVLRYVPDSVESRQVVNDSPRVRQAVQVSLADPHQAVEPETWIFDGQTARVGMLSVLFRTVEAQQLEQLLAAGPEAPESQSVGSVQVDYEGKRYEFSVEECQKGPVQLGRSGYSLRVVRYMPHAMVGRDRKLHNASNEPVNPTIEVEMKGPDGTAVWPVFANFPDFRSTHGLDSQNGPKVVFVASQKMALSAPIAILAGPEGKLYGRFRRPGREPEIKELAVGQPCPLPWGGRRLTVLQRFKHARLQRKVEPIEPVRKNRIPAVLLAVRTPAGPQEVWVQKYSPRLITAGKETYRLLYQNKQIPLGFSVMLKDFRIGHYPGTMRPRSFESHIDIINPHDGRRSSHVVSMNHPVTFGGYTFYQSSYRGQGSRMVSVLSVSRDPGQPVAFAGYLGLMGGMLLVLGQRMGAVRRRAAGRPDHDKPDRAKDSKKAKEK